MKTNLCIRLLFIAAVVSLAGLNVMAADSMLKFVGCRPASGSMIESAAFDLIFDYSEVIETNGEAEYGIACYGSSTYCTRLYEGVGADKVLVGTALDKNVTGVREEFTTGNIVSFSFPDVTLIPGKAYTLEISNRFVVQVKGSSKSVSNATCSYQSAPLEFIYYGAGDADKIILVESCSLTSVEALPALGNVVFTFGTPVELCEGAKVDLVENGEVIASSSEITVSSTGKRVVVAFGDITLYNGHSYYVTLPSGALASRNSSDVKSFVYSCKITGASYKSFGMKDSTPKADAVYLPQTFMMNFDLPEGASLVSSSSIGSSYKAYLYENTVSNRNLKVTYDGTLGTDKQSLSWTSNKFSPMPSTNYILCIPAGELKAKNAEGQYDLSCEEICIPFISPSVQEFGCAALELDTPVNGLINKDAPALAAGGRYDYLGHIQIPMVGRKYEYEGNKLDLNVNTGAEWYLYDITDGEDVLYKSGSRPVSGGDEFTTKTIEITASNTYRVVDMSINVPLLEGRKYRLVIPEGSVCANYMPISHYAVNKDWSIEFYGSGSHELELLRCTLPQESEQYKLYTVEWIFNGHWEFNPSFRPSIMYYTYSSSNTNPTWLGFSPDYQLKYDASWTRLKIYCEGASGEGYELNTKYSDWKVVLPAGALYYVADPSISSQLYEYSITRVDPPSATPEFVNLDVQLNGLSNVSHKAVKSQPATLTFAPDDYWEVKSVKLNDEDVTESIQDGVYTTPALESDATVKATLGYKGLIINDTPTQIVEIPDSSLKVFVEDGFIVVEGVVPGDLTALYSVNGLLLGAMDVTEPGHRISFSVPDSGIYIVRVNNQSVRILKP